MQLFGELGGLLLLPVALIAAFAVRRWLLSRTGGTVELSLRLRESTHGRGWVLGSGRFVGDELQWFRVFSLAPHPRRVLSRRDLSVLSRRTPTGPERLSLQAGMVVLECTTDEGLVQLAMGESALTGFLSWLESAAPGRTQAG